MPYRTGPRWLAAVRHLTTDHRAPYVFLGAALLLGLYAVASFVGGSPP